MRTVLVSTALVFGSFVLFHLGNDSMAKDSRPATVNDQMLAHNVFFTLKDKSPEAKKQLVDACKKYLSKHPGTVFFAAGTLCEELDRPVNDRDFDVGLHVIFKTKADQDRYQEAPLHLQFIEENKGNWAKVRVFDSVVEQ